MYTLNLRFISNIPDWNFSAYVRHLLMNSDIRTCEQNYCDWEFPLNFNDAHYVWFRKSELKLMPHNLVFLIRSSILVINSISFLFLRPKFSLESCVALDICRRLLSDDIWETSMLLSQDTVYCYVSYFRRISTKRVISQSPTNVQKCFQQWYQYI